jgi:hypothetical protein
MQRISTHEDFLAIGTNTLLVTLVFLTKDFSLLLIEAFCCHRRPILAAPPRIKNCDKVSEHQNNLNSLRHRVWVPFLHGFAPLGQFVAAVKGGCLQ